jgi:hypothetical protein
VLTHRPDSSKIHSSEIFILKFKILTVVLLGDSGVQGCDVLLGEWFQMSQRIECFNYQITQEEFLLWTA